MLLLPAIWLYVNAARCQKAAAAWLFLQCSFTGVGLIVQYSEKI